MHSSIKSIEESLISEFGSEKLDPKLNPVGVASYVLRAFQARSDLADAVLTLPAKDFLSGLERVRTALALGNIARARGEISSLSPLTEEERVELLLEKARIALFEKDFEITLEICKQALDSDVTPAWSRMTFLQIEGDALLALGKAHEAIAALQKAVALAELYPKASSAVTSRAFLAVAYAETDQLEKSRRQIQSLFGFLSSLEKNELWLDRLCWAIRGETHYLRRIGLEADLWVRLKEAKEISSWLGDQIRVQKCERDLVSVSPSSSGASPVYRFSNWSFLPRLDLILMESPRRIEILSDSPVMKKMLLQICEKKLTLAELFERVWLLKFKKEQHDVHVRAMISKVRKLLPPGALKITEGIVSLV